MINTDCVDVYEEEYQVHKLVSHLQVSHQQLMYGVSSTVRDHVKGQVTHKVYDKVFK